MRTCRLMDWIAGGGALALLATTAMPVAAEPVRLDDRQLDTVVAGGIIAIELYTFAAATGPGDVNQTHAWTEINAESAAGYAEALGVATAEAYACCGDSSTVYVLTEGAGLGDFVRVTTVRVDIDDSNYAYGYSQTTVLVIGFTDLDHDMANGLLGRGIPGFAWSQLRKLGAPQEILDLVRPGSANRPSRK